jgi:hypothetical protein
MFIILQAFYKGNLSNPTYDLIQSGLEQRSNYAVRLLSNLFVSQRFTDVTLIVGKVNIKEFNVHKAILGSQSAVFEAMFQEGNFKESKENRVEIPDIEADVFEQLLKWFYAGKVELEGAFAIELLVAADKVND